jgi:hypothetical protein
VQANVDDEVVPSIEQLLVTAEERLLNTEDDVTALQKEVDDLKCMFPRSEVVAGVGMKRSSAASVWLLLSFLR